MSQPRRVRSSSRSILESPWIAAGLAVVVIALVAVLLLPGLLDSAGIGASPTPGGSGGPFASPTPPQPYFVRPTPSPQPSFASYVVKSGDTLNSIARQFRTTARSIAWWNRGVHPSLDPESGQYNPNNLKVGWVLRVLPDTVVDDNNPPPANGTPSP